MTNKPSINNCNKSRNIKLIECTYNGPNKRGDFKFEIKEQLKNPNYQGQKTLWLFNDNHKHRLTSKEGGGNAVIRPYNKYGKYKSNPHSAGITTGTYGTLFKSGKGYESLDKVIKSDRRSARNNIDDDMKNIKELLKTGNYNKVKIITDEDGLIGNKIFKIDIEVKHYIKDELNKVIDELNNSSSLQKTFNNIKKINIKNLYHIKNNQIPNVILPAESIKKKTPYLKKLKNKFSKKKKAIYQSPKQPIYEPIQDKATIVNRKKNIVETHFNCKPNKKKIPEQQKQLIQQAKYKKPPSSISNRLLEKNLKPKQFLSNNSNVLHLLNNSERINGGIGMLPNVGKKKKNQQKNKSTKNKSTKNKPTKKKKRN